MMRMQTLQVMHMDEPAMVTRRDAFLFELRVLGLNPAEIGWKDGVGCETMQHLEAIIAWVRRWRATGGNRELMVRQGYAYPPVKPGCNPEQDWRCFTRWLAGPVLPADGADREATDLADGAECGRGKVGQAFLPPPGYLLGPFHAQQALR